MKILSKARIFLKIPSWSKTQHGNHPESSRSRQTEVADWMLVGLEVLQMEVQRS